jgi:hypothetical protein
LGKSGGGGGGGGGGKEGSGDEKKIEPDEYFLHKICHTLQKIIQITIPFITNKKKYLWKISEIFFYNSFLS